MLKPLSVEVRQCLRSGVAISSYAQAAEELIQNAVDAAATCVAVRVDLDRKKLQVVDNGSGVNRDGLENIAERYHTSKCTSVEDLESRLQHYGYRGEALASIRNMSYLLDIESKAKGSTSTYTKLFKDGILESLKQSDRQRASPGTTVTVYDLFSRMPVRNKAMKKALELERIKKNVEAISLIHPKVSFSLRDEETGCKILQTHKSNSVIGAFTHLFGNVKARSLCEVTYHQEDDETFNVHGYVGKDGHSNKNLQFVYINSRLVLKTKIHKLINHCMSKTTVLRKKGFNVATKWSPGNTTEDIGANRHTERHAMFVVDIECPLSAYDITFDPRKTLVEFKDWDTLLRCVETAVKRFIDRENLSTVGEKLDRNSPGIQAMVLGSPMALDSQDSQEDEGHAVGLQEKDTGESQEQEQDCTSWNVSLNTSVYGSSITTSDMTNVLQSKVVKRNIKTSDKAQDDNCDVNVSSHVDCNNGVSEDICEQTHTFNGEGVGPAKNGQTVIFANDSIIGDNLMCESASDPINSADQPGTNAVNSSSRQSPPKLMTSFSSSSSHKETVVDGRDLSDRTIGLNNRAAVDEVQVQKPDDSPPCLEPVFNIPYSDSHESPPQLAVEASSAIHMKATHTDIPLETAQNIVGTSNPCIKETDCKSISNSSGIRYGSDLPGKRTVTTSPVLSDEKVNHSETNDIKCEEKGGSCSSCFSDGSSKQLPVSPMRSKDYHKSNHSPRSTDHVKKLQSMKVQLKEKRILQLHSSNSKERSLKLSPVRRLNQVLLRQNMDKRLMTPEQKRNDTTVSLHRKSSGKLLSPLLRLRRKYEHLQKAVKNRAASSSPRKRRKCQPKEDEELLVDAQIASTSKQEGEEKQKTVSNSTKNAEKHDFMGEDPLPVLFSPTTTRKSVQVTLVDSGDAILNQWQSTAFRMTPPVMSANRSLLSPLQRIRERLLAKARARRANGGVKTASGDLTKFSSCKKHADVSKHKNSPRQTKTCLSEKGGEDKDLNNQIKDQISENPKDSDDFDAKPEKELPHLPNHAGGGTFLHDCENIRKRKLCQSGHTTLTNKLAKQSKVHLENCLKNSKNVGTESGKIGHHSLREWSSGQSAQRTRQFQVESEKILPTLGTPKRLISCSDLEEALNSLGRSGGIPSVPKSCSSLFSQLAQVKVPLHHRIDRKSTETSDPLKPVQGHRSFMTSDDFFQSASKFDFKKAMKTMDCSVSETNLQSEKLETHQPHAEEHENSLEQSYASIASNKDIIIDNVKDVVVESNVNTNACRTFEKTHSLTETVSLCLTLNSRELPTHRQINSGIDEKDMFNASSTEAQNSSVLSHYIEMPASENEWLPTLGQVNSDVEDNNCSQTSSTEVQNLAVLSPHIDVPTLETEGLPTLGQMNSDKQDSQKSETSFADNIEDSLVLETGKDCNDAQCISPHLNSSESLGQTKANSVHSTRTNGGIESPHDKNTQEYGDFTKAFDNVFLECEVSCDKSEDCDIEDNSSGTRLNCGKSSKEPLAEMCESSERVQRTEESVSMQSGNTSGDLNTCDAKLSENAGELIVHKERGMSKDHSESVSVSMGKRRSYLLPCTAEAFIGPESVRCKVSNTSMQAEEMSTAVSTVAQILQETGSEEPEGSSSVKWRSQKITESEQTSVARLLEEWDNPMFKIDATPVVNAGVGSEDRLVQRIHALSHPVNFTKDMLQHVKVLGQIDNKFIACLMKSSTSEQDEWDLLVVVDQHAAHERVRLETFTKDLYADIDSRQLKSSKVDPALQVSTTESTVRVMEAYRSYFTRIGVDFTTQGRDRVLVHSVPACFVQEEGTNSKPTDMAFLLRQIQLLIREQVDVFEKIHGANVTLPRIIHQVLSARACHGAIKFGDDLSLRECEDLIVSLRECQLPFQCAHGRPSIMPVLDTTQLGKQSETPTKPQLHKLREMRSTQD